MLTFSPANAKTKALYNVGDLATYLRGKRKVYSLDLTAGKTCPGAKECLAWAEQRKDDPSRFTIVDGPDCRYRCFSASQEVVYPAVRKMRARNTALLRATKSAAQAYRLLADSLPANCGVLRLHVSGDFFKRSYFLAVVKLAESRPDVLFYAYTKSLPFIQGVSLPSNLRLTASRGGKYDHLIEGLGIREAVVVFAEQDAVDMGLDIDHDDSHAATNGGSFALLIHGVQPAKSAASAALSALKGKGSYAR